MDQLGYKCPLCKKNNESNKTPYLSQIWSNHKIFRNSSISTCNSCGLSLAFPSKNSDELFDFYENAYRDKKSPFFIDFHNFETPFSRDHRSIAQLLLATQFIEFADGDVFLDLGPGYGTSFKEFSNIFIQNRVIFCGLEFSKGASKYYEKLYKAKTLTGLANYNNNFKTKPKLILSSHSLEHFEFNNALNFLISMRDYIAHDGCCVFEVPNVDFRYHKNFRGADEPHLMFFSKMSLEKLFQIAGYEILFCETCGEPYKTSDKKINNHRLDFILKNKTKLFFKFILNKFPKLKSWLSTKVSFVDVSSHEFQYLGNRKCLRIVARPIITQINRM